MSAKKFKVGDKVKIRKGLTDSSLYNHAYIERGVELFGGKTLTIKEVRDDFYFVEENCWAWDDKVLEAAGEPLDNFCVGDDISRGSGVRKVLAAVNGCYLLSNTDEYTIANDWYTADELKQIGYQVLPPGHSITLIEIDGKRYDEAEVKKAIKDLEPID